jgi:hypothetical protein
VRGGCAGGIEDLVNIGLPICILSHLNSCDKDLGVMDFIEDPVGTDSISPGRWAVISQAFDIGTVERIHSQNPVNIFRQFSFQALFGR